MTTVCSIKAFVDSDAIDIQRRPPLSDATFLHVGKNIAKMLEGNCLEGAEAYCIQYFSTD